jgi:amidase
MPIAHTDGGLPIGVQIVGGYLEDLTTIAFAGLIERELGGFTRFKARLNKAPEHRIAAARSAA